MPKSSLTSTILPIGSINDCNFVMDARGGCWNKQAVVGPGSGLHGRLKTWRLAGCGICLPVPRTRNPDGAILIATEAKGRRGAVGRGITIEDVASAASVSRQTVSRVINRQPNVSPAARERVEAAIAALGYVPSLAARAMGGGRSQLLLAVIAREEPLALAARMPLDAMLLAGIAACGAQHYRLLFDQVDPGEAGAQQLAEAVGALQPDGVILLPPLDDRTDLHAALTRRAIPFTTLAERVAAGRATPGAEDADHAESAARRLIDLGHRQIAFMTGTGDPQRSQHRLAGYRRALVQKGSRAHHHFVAEAPLDFTAATEQARSWLVPTIRPTAIIAETAEVALAAAQVARGLRLFIPRDVTLVALEDRPDLARCQPPLAALYRPHAALFAAACERLMGPINGSADADRLPEWPEPLTLAERGSIGRAPRAV